MSKGSFRPAYFFDEIQYAQDWDKWLKTIYDMQPDTKVVATGGLSRLVADNTELIDVVDPQLVLDGLRIIYERARR